MDNLNQDEKQLLQMLQNNSQFKKALTQYFRNMGKEDALNRAKEIEWSRYNWRYHDDPTGPIFRDPFETHDSHEILELATRGIPSINDHLNAMTYDPKFNSKFFDEDDGPLMDVVNSVCNYLCREDHYKTGWNDAFEDLGDRGWFDTHLKKRASVRLTASDRGALIRLASGLPSGSTERRAILAGLLRDLR